jgi:hypothetical protein
LFEIYKDINGTSKGPSISIYGKKDAGVASIPCGDDELTLT